MIMIIIIIIYTEIILIYVCVCVCVTAYTPVLARVHNYRTTLEPARVVAATTSTVLDFKL